MIRVLSFLLPVFIAIAACWVRRQEAKALSLGRALEGEEQVFGWGEGVGILNIEY
jgi:hypothetical protein